ncbi:MAG: hypothetical protein AAF460_17165, partial [Pseudomonadota bacterium]
MIYRLLNPRTWTVLLLATALQACSWVDGTGKQTNTTPEIQLDQPVRVYTEGDTARIPVSDDDTVSARFTLTGSGPSVAGACAEQFLPAESAADLAAACVGYISAEQCTVAFTQNVDNPNEFVASIPALTRSVAQRYLIEVQDQTGAEDVREVDLCMV